MRPVNPLRASTIASNFIEQKELYTNHANLIKELLQRTEELSRLISQEKNSTNNTNQTNRETFIALQTEINKLKVAASESTTKVAVESLSNTLNELSLNTSNDVNTIREDISVLKRATNDLTNVKSTVSKVKTDMSAFKDTLQSIETNLDQLRQSSVDALRQELLEVIEKSIPTFNTSPSVDEDVVQERSVIVSDSDRDYPCDMSDADSFEANGVFMTSTPKDKDRLCSLVSSYGGISIDKYGSYDRWVIERNTDPQLRFHYNKEANPALVIDQKGISVPELTINDRKIKSITNTFTENNINNHTVPTTKAIFDFVHANKLLKNINTDAIHPAQPIECNVQTYNLNGKHTLVVHNDSCSIALKDDNALHTIKASLQDGLRVNDIFKLSNDEGILCYMSVDKLPSDLESIEDAVGLFANCTGNIEPIISNDEENILYVPEVKIPQKVTTSVVGVITKIISPSNHYTKSNRIYNLDSHKFTSSSSSSEDVNDPNDEVITHYFVTIAVKGIVKVKVATDSKPALGQLMIPTNGGKATLLSTEDITAKKDKKDKDKTDDKLMLCMRSGVPRVKVIASHNDPGSFFGLLIF